MLAARATTGKAEAMTRGLIVGETGKLLLQSGGFEGMGEDEGPSRQQVRYWLLFWDQAVHARNALLGGGPLPDRDFLLDVGFLSERPAPPIQGNFSLPGVLQDAYSDALLACEREQPGSWAMATGLGTLDPEEGELFDGVEDRGLLVRLYGAIPVPDKDVHLNDVLEFKAKRTSELAALRHQIEQIYLKAGSNDDDPAVAIRLGLEKVAVAGADCVRVMRERKLPFKMTTELASLNLASAVIAGAASLAAHQPIEVIAGNVLTAGFSTTLAVSWKGRAKAGVPFQYVADFHDEVFGE